MNNLILKRFFRRFSLTCFLILALAQGSCTTAPTGRSQLMLVSDDQMNELGGQSFSKLKRETPIETDIRINAYVRCIANNIVQYAKDGTGVQSWEVVVFRDNSANAFALPGGKIGVHTGILQVAKTADQLASVIGHEVGHVTARHGAERLSQVQLTQGAMVLTGAVFATQKESRTQGLILAGLGLGAQYGVLLPFSRKHESEADEVGLYLMAEAGFDPRASVDLWKNMSVASGGKAPPQFMSTHPSNNTRISDLNSNMAKALRIYQKSLGQGRNPNCTL
jgi:predicted Zn-dependent protease